MDINIRKYEASNLLIIDIADNKGRLKNILVISYSDNKKDISLKKVVFDSDMIFLDIKDYKILNICEEIVYRYGEDSDIEKLWLADKIFDVLDFKKWRN